MLLAAQIPLKCPRMGVVNLLKTTVGKMDKVGAGSSVTVAVFTLTKVGLRVIVLNSVGVGVLWGVIRGSWGWGVARGWGSGEGTIESHKGGEGEDYLHPACVCV